MSAKPKPQDVINANIEVHTALSGVYNDDPHFRPENQKKVRGLLRDIRGRISSASPVKMLDMGCGTGFLLHLAADMFDELHGVDVTKAMIDQVDISKGNITTHICAAERSPFENGYFDCVTAYSFMDHLLDLKPYLQEVYRVLKPGGIYFSDQNANKAYWDGLATLDPSVPHTPVVTREINASLGHQDYTEIGLTPESLKTAEYIKFIENGIDGEATALLAKEIGFSKVEVAYDWFMGEANILHGQSYEAARIIESWLHEVEPLSRRMFKYIRFIFVK